MTHQPLPDHLSITTILRDTFPSIGAIEEMILLKESDRCRVFRCRIAGGDEAPSGAIVKQILTQEECGFSDWGSLRFIATDPVRRDLAPGFYGGDREKGIYLMEDLGGSLTLDDLMRGDDREAAIDGLMRLATRCARLHRSSSGAPHEAAFRAIRSALPGDEGLGREREAERWSASLDRVRTWFALAGIALDERFDGECAGINLTYRQPGAFLAFTHGDIAPSNNHLRDGELRLIDFEYGGFRHALYDMAVWNVLCPLPEALLVMLLESYRTEYLAAAPELNGRAFTREWERICIWRGMAMLGWFSTRTMEENGIWIDAWTTRDALLRTVMMIARSASHAGDLPGIAESFGRLARALAARWPDATGTIPSWRALADDRNDG